MSFESVYRSRQGAREIEKIAKFIGSLVIKNEYEARRGETTDSLANYYSYYGAYTNTDDFTDYSLEERTRYADLVWIWWNAQKGLGYNVTKDLLETLTKSTQKALKQELEDKVPAARDYLRGLRNARIFDYDEKNLYYKQFLGLPNKDEDIVYVINMDEGDNGYTEVTDLSGLPDENLIYFTKVDDETFESLGKLKAWYMINDEGIPKKVANNFYYMNTIPIHMIDKITYPLTYNYFILQQHIKEVIDANPNLYYIRFIGEGKTPFFLRTLPNYAIIKYDNNILTPTELSYFFKAYDKARKQVVLDYINGFDSKQPLYNLLMIQNLLYFTVMNYSNSYIERYSVGIYTEENCNNILESHGYSKLTEIKDLDLKQRIVKNLNDLIENKGNNYILELILNKILQDPNSELKRYYLEKKYKETNLDASIKIDTSKGLENCIDLVLREVPVTSINELSDTADKYHDYDQFVSLDDSWGGIDSTDTTESKQTKKEYLKRQLLSTDFNKILTKYITLTRSIDILESQREIRDLSYIMLKYFDDHDSDDFFKKKFSFGMYEVTPASLLAASCWLQQMKFYDDPDTIVKDNCVINSSVVFRKMGMMAVDRNKLESETFIVDGKPMVVYDISPEIGSWKVIDFMRENPDEFADYLAYISEDGKRLPTVRLTDKVVDGVVAEKGILDLGIIPRDGIKHLESKKADIEDYMTRFRYYEEGRDLGEVLDTTTFSELVTDYKNQYPNLIKRITLKLRNSYDYREYQAWNYMLEQSRTSNSVEFIFKGYEKFSEFITAMESDSLINYIIGETNWRPGHIEMDKICEVQQKINSAFKEWVTNNFSSLVYLNDESSDSKDASFVQDMILLFNEFLSVFSELYSVDYKYTFGNKDYEGLDLQLFYNPINVYQTQKFNDNINLSYSSKTRFYSELQSDKIELSHELNSKVYGDLVDAINRDLNYDQETNEYIPDDPFEYEQKLHFSELINDTVSLNHVLGAKAKCRINDNLGLTGILTIKPSYKESKTYYETNS